MSSSTLTVHPHLPPTTNTLNSQQRLRLMRSTRKLGAVLGTTPYLLENDMSFVLLPFGNTTPRSLKRQGSIFTHYQSSSLSVTSTSTSPASSHHPSPSASSITLPCSALPRFESSPSNPPGLSTTTTLKRRGDRVPHLYLRLDAVPVSPTDDRVASSLPPTPCTPSPPTPITPPVPNATEVRRRRMAKLARHLGENVPTELVFPSDAAPKSTTLSPGDCLNRRRSQSVHVTPTQLASISDNRPSLGRSRQDWVGEWNRSDIKDVQKELRNLKVR